MVRTSRTALALLACLASAHSAAATTLLVEFTSPDCGPCRGMRPTIERLMAEGYQVRHVDVSTRPELARQFRVTRWPTFLVLVDGREQARLVGIASHAQLVEMLHRVDGGAAAVRPATPAMFTASERPPAAFAKGPEVGRIVDLQDPTAPRPTAAARGPAPAAPNAAALIAATVRLSITDPDGQSTGTGAIVDAREGEALVLTCGHLFRSSNGQGAIEISLFADGPNGAEVRSKVAGVLVDFDLDRDLALVRFVTDEPVAVAPIAPPGSVMQPGAAVTSVGCNHGANPTARSTQVTAIDRYVGHPNIEAAGAPVEGRSGGGLFNAQGQLVGVCYAADPQSDEGLYASLPSIYAKLDALGLSKIYQSPAGGQAAPTRDVASMSAASQTGPAASLASATSAGARATDPALEPPFAVRGQNPTAEPASPFVSQAPAPGPIADPAIAPASAATSPGPAAARLTPQEQAALEEIQRRSVDAEIICIIRPRTGDGPSDVIKIPSASPALVQALAAAREPAPASTAATGGNMTR